jgi:hypothetical protein
MLHFGVTIPATEPQRSEIPEGLMNYPVYPLWSGSVYVTVWTFRSTAIAWFSQPRSLPPLFVSSNDTFTTTYFWFDCLRTSSPISTNLIPYQIHPTTTLRKRRSRGTCTTLYSEGPLFKQTDILSFFFVVFHRLPYSCHLTLSGHSTIPSCAQENGEAFN